MTQKSMKKVDTITGETLITNINKIVINNIVDYGIHSSHYEISLYNNNKLVHKVDGKDNVTSLFVNGGHKIKNVVLSGNLFEVVLEKPTKVIIYEDPVRIGEKIVECVR